MNQKEFALSLKVVSVFVLLMVIAAVSCLVPMVGQDVIDRHPEYSYLYLPCMLYIIFGVLPVIVILVFAWKVFNEIAKDNSFCAENAKRLKIIGIISLCEAIYLAIGLLVFLQILNSLLLIVIFTIAIVIFVAFSVICSTLSHLTLKASALKAENDLTI